MVKFSAFIFAAVLTSTGALSRADYAPIYIKYKKLEMQKNDCYFGDTTSASKLEHIRYELITKAHHYDSDPNLP